MIVFPPAAAVSVVLNGRPVRAYHRAFALEGRTYAPLQPFVTEAADRMWYDGGVLVVARGNHTVRIALAPRTPGALANAYVPLARVLRALGAHVTYDARRVEVRFPARAVGLPTPFDASVPSAAPLSVFTPTPIPTPRPVWSGTPLPRRTPIPVAAPTPRPPARRGASVVPPSYLW